MKTIIGDINYGQVIVVERIFKVPVGRVWKAISDKDEMKAWYFDLPQFKPVVGAEFQFTGGTEEKQYLHLCKVTAVVRGKKLAYSWRYDGYGGNSVVTFELFDESTADGPKTRLRLTHEGVETFPDVADFAKKNFEEGWNGIINESLKKYLGE